MSTSKRQVYLISNGEYSDYGIVRIFSDRSTAERFLELHKQTPCEDPRIQEWAIDDWDQEEIVRTAYHAAIYLATGTLLQPYQSESTQMANPRTRVGSINRAPNPDAPKAILSVTSFISIEHARKLAVEGRQRWLRDRAFDFTGFDVGESGE